MPEDEKYKEQYINDSLENGEFKVIPFVNMFFNISYNRDNIKIKYCSKDDIITKKNSKEMKDALIYDINDLYYEEIKPPKNILEGYIYIDNNNHYKLYIFSFWWEIDGLFQVESNIYSFDYKSYIIYSCQKYNNNKLVNISKDSIIIYEIKSGDDLYILTTLIIKKYDFLEKFFNCFPLYKKKEIP